MGGSSKCDFTAEKCPLPSTKKHKVNAKNTKASKKNKRGRRESDDRMQKTQLNSDDSFKSPFDSQQCTTTRWNSFQHLLPQPDSHKPTVSSGGEAFYSVGSLLRFLFL